MTRSLRHRRILGLLALLAIACAIGTTCSRGAEHSSANDTERVRQFVEDTMNLELGGQRWLELLGQAKEGRFYSRIAWPPESEPGWDTFYVNESYEISRIGSAESRTFDQYQDGEVRSATATGFGVDIVLRDAFKFGTDWVQPGTQTTHTIFVIERNGKFLIADRLVAPRFDRSAASRVLETPQFRAPALDDLRQQLRSSAAR